MNNHLSSAGALPSRMSMGGGHQPLHQSDFMSLRMMKMEEELFALKKGQNQKVENLAHNLKNKLNILNK